MKYKIFIFNFLLIFITSVSTVVSQGNDSLILRSIFSEALAHPAAYGNLEYLCRKIGGRICGTDKADQAVYWAKNVLDKMKPDTVYLQPVMVSHWERGEESCRILSEKNGQRNLHVCAIGGSVSAPAGKISSEVVEVQSFDQLKAMGRRGVEGKIVFFNRPADPTSINTFQAYGGAVDQRSRGANHAGWYGAAAVIVRSATTAHDDFPHTGILHYADTVKAIPAMSVSTNDADTLSKWLKSDTGLKLEMRLTTKSFPERQSYNVIGEIRGSVNPSHIIVIGGHLDSWDNGEGAHDDGAGVVQSIEVLRIFKALNIKPKNTIRAVVYMDEECNQRGGKVYGSIAAARDSTGVEKHLLAIEADRGGTTPAGFSIDGNDRQIQKIKEWKSLFFPYGLWFIEQGGSGVDIRSLKTLGIPLVGLVTDSQRYFDYHHSANDTFDKINVRELELGAAAMTALVWMWDQSPEQ